MVEILVKMYIYTTEMSFKALNVHFSNCLVQSREPGVYPRVDTSPVQYREMTTQANAHSCGEFRLISKPNMYVFGGIWKEPTQTGRPSPAGARNSDLLATDFYLR